MRMGIALTAPLVFLLVLRGSVDGDWLAGIVATGVILAAVWCWVLLVTMTRAHRSRAPQDAENVNASSA
jgi:hypothetical protein